MCPKCGGRGGWRDPWGHWRRCSCKQRNARTEAHTGQMMLDTETDETRYRKARNALQTRYARGEIDADRLALELASLAIQHQLGATPE